MKAVLLAVCAVILAVQLLLAGFIGIADNGDFAKVSKWLCLVPRGAATNFEYVQSDYVWSARNFWDSPFHCSESALATDLTVSSRQAGRFRTGRFRR